MSAEPIVGVAASTAIRPLLRGPRQVLARTVTQPHAVGFGPLAMVMPDSLRPPHACLTTDVGVVQRLGRCDRIVVGAGRVTGADTDVGIRRWWDPCPRLATTDCARLTATLDRLHDMGTAPASTAAAERLLSDILLHGHPADGEDRGGRPGADDVLAAVRPLVGSGCGLTPEGDDMLIGLLAGLTLLPTAVGHVAPPWTATVRSWVTANVSSYTTDLSARLLVHATTGNVPVPVSAVMQAMTDPARSLSVATARLLAVGHTSGAAMARGLVLAGRVVRKRAATMEGVRPVARVGM